jgi:hypothetical protein
MRPASLVAQASDVSTHASPADSGGALLTDDGAPPRSLLVTKRQLCRCVTDAAQAEHFHVSGRADAVR